MNLPRIGPAISIAPSNYIGTTLQALSTFQCQNISKNSSKNISIRCLPNHNIAHTRQHQNNTGQGRSTSPSPDRHLSQVIQRRNKRNSTNRQEHFLLRTGGQHHGPHGPQLNRKRTNMRHHEYNGNGKGQAIVRLPCHTPRCDHSVPRVGHVFECPFRCILPLRDEGT